MPASKWARGGGLGLGGCARNNWNWSSASWKGKREVIFSSLLPGLAWREKKEGLPMPTTSRSDVINDALAGGYDFQVGVRHFKRDWKDKVDPQFQEKGAWIPRKVPKRGTQDHEFHYLFGAHDHAPSVVKAEDAKKWKKHVEAVAAKLHYEFTNGQTLFHRGKLTSEELQLLPKENRTVNQFWKKVGAHMVAKSKWTSHMVTILEEELQQQVDACAPAMQRGPQPRRGKKRPRPHH